MGEQKFKVAILECPCDSEVNSLPLAVAFFSATLAINSNFMKITREACEVMATTSKKDGANIAVFVVQPKGGNFLEFLFICGKEKISSGDFNIMADYVFDSVGKTEIQKKMEGKLLHTEPSFSIALPRDFIRDSFMYISKKATFHNSENDSCEVFYIDKKSFDKRHIKECSLISFRLNQLKLVPWTGLYALKEEDDREYLVCRTRAKAKGRLIHFDSYVLKGANGIFVVNVGGTDEDVFERVNSKAIALSFNEGDYSPLDKTERLEKIAIISLDEPT